MMNQEMYVNIKDLREQGWTLEEISAETGWHPATISRRLRQGPPPAKRPTPDSSKVMNARWSEKVQTLIGDHPRLLGISVFRCLQAEGFEGGYSTVTRELRRIRGPRFTAADRVSVPIHTDPGEEAQFDFCHLDEWARRWGWNTPLRCFGMIMCWSRERIWWFTTAEDREHTFEGMIRFFETVGGIPTACRTDRMGALGTSQGRRFVLHPPTIAFAAHHGTKITPCKAGDAKRKGKVERPFRQLQQTLLPELEAQGIPASLDELNHRAAVWLDANVHAVESRTTGARPVDRAAVEVPFLSPLPADRFDTDYVESRRVHNIVPFISIDGARYSVPPETLGQRVEIRRASMLDRQGLSVGPKLGEEAFSTSLPLEVVDYPKFKLVINRLVNTMIRLGRNIGNAILETARERRSDLILLSWVCVMPKRFAIIERRVL